MTLAWVSIALDHGFRASTAMPLMAENGYLVCYCWIGAVEKDKDYRVGERSYGSFLRSVELPAGVDPDSIKAIMKDGILEVTVPKPATAESRKVGIRTAA